jgi:5-methylthioadenosine/S-adenosylhomocysteine deaminase
VNPGPLTVSGAVLDGETVGVRCVDGRIAALGGGVAAESGDETIDAAGAPLVAPLVNGHTHAAMTLFRGHGGDLPLMRWLREVVWPIEAKLEPEDVYWGTRLACLEMIRNGTASFWDMYWHPGETARAVRDAGLRATIGGPLFDADGNTTAMREASLRNLDELAGFGDEIGAALAPHSIYMVSEGLLRWTAVTAGEHGVAVHIHLSETEQEVVDCVERHGLRPAAYLDRLGMLGETTVLAHGVWLDEAELELIAERGCTVVTNPVANMKLAVGGVFPYPAARGARGARRRRRDRPWHRRPRLQRLARPLRRPEGVRPPPTPRRGRRHRPPGSRGVAGRHRRPLAASPAGAEGCATR